MTEKHIVIDTDAGQDDLMAIALLMNCPGIVIDAVTVCNGLAHVEIGARNIARLFAMTGKTIPVYAGHPVPLQGDRGFPAAWRQISDELPGALSMSINGRFESEHAVDYLLRRCADRETPLYILALGPLTNLALVYQHDPDVFRNIKEISFMGGAFHVPGNVYNSGEFITPTNLVEWNFFVDPVAAHKVCTAGVPMVFVPLDATNQVPITTRFIEKFLSLPLNATGRVVGAILQSAKHLLKNDRYFAWDPLAALSLVNKNLFRFEELTFDLVHSGSDAGQTRVSVNGACHAQVAVDADGEGFFDYFYNAFTE